MFLDTFESNWINITYHFEAILGQDLYYFKNLKFTNQLKIPRTVFQRSSILVMAGKSGENSRTLCPVLNGYLDQLTLDQLTGHSKSQKIKVQILIVKCIFFQGWPLSEVYLLKEQNIQLFFPTPTTHHHHHPPMHPGTIPCTDPCTTQHARHYIPNPTPPNIYN